MSPKVKVLGFKIASPGDNREEWGSFEEDFINSFSGKIGEVKWWDDDPTHPVMVRFEDLDFKECRFSPVELEPAG